MSNVTDICVNSDLDSAAARLRSGQARMAGKRGERASVDNTFKEFCLTEAAERYTEKNVRLRTSFCCSYLLF